MFRPLSGTMNEHVLDLPVRLCGCWNTWCFRGISLKTVNMALQCTCHISVEHAQTLNRELEILPQTQAADSTTRQQQIRIVSGPSSSTFVCFSCCASYLPRAYLFAFLRIYENCLVKTPSHLEHFGSMLWPWLHSTLLVAFPQILHAALHAAPLQIAAKAAGCVLALWWMSMIACAST